MSKSDVNVAALSPAELEKRVQKAVEHLDAIEELIPGRKKFKGSHALKSPPAPS
jgi:hypothetical protein